MVELSKQERKNGTPHVSVLLLLAILGVAFSLRLYRLQDANIWWDEGLAVWAARQSPLEIARWTAADVHPPFYFWLLHLWRRLVGDSEFAVRFLSVGAGTLTVAAVWYLGRLVAPRRKQVAILAATLVALSRFAVWWSQETRMYMLAGLLATLSLAFTVRVRHRWNWRNAVGYLLTTIAALWTLYLLAFLLLIEGLYWLWSLRGAVRQAGQLIGRWAGLQAAVLIAVAPWLLYALPRMRSWSAQEPFDPVLFIDLYATLLTLGISTNVNAYRLPVLVVIALLALGLIVLALRRSLVLAPPSDGLALLLPVLLIPPAAVWLVTMLPRSFGYVPHPEARYLLPFAPAFYVLLARAVTALGSWRSHVRRGAVIPGVLWLLGLAVVLGITAWPLHDYYAARYLKDDYQSVALTLNAHRRPTDVVVLHTDEPWPIFAYHWPEAFEGTPHLQDADPGGAEYFLAPLWQAYDGVWLVINEDALRVDPQGYFEQWLSERAAARHEWRFGARRVVLFAKTQQRARTMLTLKQGFSPAPPPSSVGVDGLRLVGWEQPLRRLRAGTVAHVAAYVQRSRRGAGGRLSLSLGARSYGQTSITVPSGAGIHRLPLHVRVAPDAPGREVQWLLRLTGAGAPLERVEAVMGTLEIIALPPSRQTDVTPAHAVDATFGEPPIVRLVGYDVVRRDTGVLRVTLYWETVATPATSYKVFTHLINAEGRVETQRDGVPVQGSRPTTTWRAGERIIDTYDIPIEGVPAERYSLKVGFYDPVTGERLSPVRDVTGAVQAKDQIVLEEVVITD